MIIAIAVVKGNANVNVKSSIRSKLGKIFIRNGLTSLNLKPKKALGT